MDTEYNPPIDISHTQTKKTFRIKHTITNPNFFVIGKISKDYIANHIKKYFLFLFKCDFILFYNNDFLKPILVETDLYHKASLINLKRYLLYEIDNFIEKGYIFSYIVEMDITTNNDKIIMAHDYYITRPMPAVELKLNMIISKNPHLIKSLNRSHFRPIIRNYSYIR